MQGFWLVASDGGTTWSDMAEWYDQLLVAGSGPHELATTTTLALLPSLAHRSVLDVACGQGMATREVARAGAAQVVGVDLSDALVALARGHGTPASTAIDYRVDDAQTLSTIGDATVDLATCQLGLMDIPDLDATLRSVDRVLRPGGQFVFVIGHPCFLAPNAMTAPDAAGRPGRQISDYFDERFWRSSNPAGVRRVGNYHRTISTYLNALVAADFTVEEVAEPRATARLADRQPEYANVPIFFAARARRSDARRTG